MKIHLSKTRLPQFSLALGIVAFLLLLPGLLARADLSATPRLGPSAAPMNLNWTELQTAHSPSPRCGMAMAFDPVSKKIVLFGGFGSAGYLNDTWTFDGMDWTQDNPSVAPPPRTASQMAYDAITQKLVMFGGYNGKNYLGDTWTWDGAASAWTEEFPADSPKAATGPSLFTDPATGHADNFGGFDGMFYQLETWQWTGTDWLRLHPRTSPTARGFALSARNAENRYVVLFGGLGDVNPYNTWTWDGTDWTQQSPALQPPLLYSSAAAYEPVSGAVILFGGGSGGVDMNQTWAWVGRNWQFVTTQYSPSPREGLGMAYDRAINHIVVFGGLDQGTELNDTWELDVHR